MKKVYRVEAGRAVLVRGQRATWRTWERSAQPYRIMLALVRMAEGVRS